MPGKNFPIKTKYCEIWVDTHGILCLEVAENAEIDLNEVKACFKVYQDLGYGNNNKVLQIMYAQKNFNITAEARDFGAKNGKNVFIASAVLSDSLATRILLNFFIKFSKSEVPMLMFNTEQKAREWLLSFKK